ncbi:MAG: FkbM family methyltransferase [Actinomycetota bacterium]|nr:FkbM family methyltransferase [Actinomycetota bacterium]
MSGRRDVRAVVYRAYGRLAGEGGSRARMLRSVPGARAAHAAILRRLRTRSVLMATVDGMRLLVHGEGVVGRNLLLHGQYESYESDLFRSAIVPGTTVIDVGANIGYYSLIASRLVGEGGRVVSFEPHPEIFGLLTANRERNSAENVIPLNLALSDRTGATRLYLSPIDHGKHSLSASNASGVKSRLGQDTGARSAAMSVWVPVMRLDDVLSEVGLPGVSVMKIDVEGAEQLVLGGAGSLLGTAAPLTLLMEYWPDGIARLGGDPDGLLAMLEDAGFRISAIDHRNRRLIPGAAAAIRDICGQQADAQVDLYCVRS